VEAPGIETEFKSAEFATLDGVLRGLWVGCDQPIYVAEVVRDDGGAAVCMTGGERWGVSDVAGEGMRRAVVAVCAWRGRRGLAAGVGGGMDAVCAGDLDHRNLKRKRRQGLPLDIAALMRHRSARFLRSKRRLSVLPPKL
jgi:hypothetical protein